MNQALLGKMNEVRISAPPELAGLVDVLDQLLRYAEEPIDSPILNRFGDALKVFAKVRARVWEIQRRCESDTTARFRLRSAATITGVAVLALISLPDELLDAHLQRLEDFVISTNAAIVRNREETERQEVIKRNTEVGERARKMSADQIIKEIEAGGAELSADTEGRITIKGTLMQNARLMIEAQRDRVVGCLRDRQRAAERREVI
jgi:hypothetical protein